MLVALLIAQGFIGNVRVAAGTNNSDILYQYSTAVGDTLVYGVILLFVLWIADWQRDLLALTRPSSWRQALLLARWRAFVGSYIVIAIVLDPLFHGGREQGVVPTHWVPSHAGAYAANWVVVAVVAPIVEELTYRGVGYSLLVPFGKWPAIVAVGILFAASHGLLQAFPELAVLGCALAWLRSRTGSVYPGMLVHSAFNSVALAYVFFAAR